MKSTIKKAKPIAKRPAAPKPTKTAQSIQGYWKNLGNLLKSNERIEKTAKRGAREMCNVTDGTDRKPTRTVVVGLPDLRKATAHEMQIECLRRKIDASRDLIARLSIQIANMQAKQVRRIIEFNRMTQTIDLKKERKA